MSEKDILSLMTQTDKTCFDSKHQFPRQMNTKAWIQIYRIDNDTTSLINF